MYCIVFDIIRRNIHTAKSRDFQFSFGFKLSTSTYIQMLMYQYNNIK